MGRNIVQDNGDKGVSMMCPQPEIRVKMGKATSASDSKKDGMERKVMRQTNGDR